MPDMDEESYLDKLLNSVEQKENPVGESDTSDKATEELSAGEMLQLFGDAGMLSSDEADEPEEIIELEDLKAKKDKSKNKEETPDFDNIEMSEHELERLSAMELDSIIDGVNEALTAKDLFGDEANEADPQQEALMAAINANAEVKVEKESDAAGEVKAEKESDAAGEVKPEVEQPEVSDGGQDSDSDSATQLQQLDADNADNADNVKGKNKKAKKEKAKKEKSEKGGFGAFIKNIFFVNDESTEESENAKKTAKKAQQEKKNKEKQDKNELKSTTVNEQGQAELDENQKLIKEMDEQGAEETVKQGFFQKLKYRIHMFMKKSAEEDALEDEAEAKAAAEKKKAKQEKQEADKIKKEEAKEEKAKKAEEAKAKKEAKKKEKKDKPKPVTRPEDILKIKPQSMILFILFVVGAIVLIIMLNNTVSYNSAISKAQANMENGNYGKAYQALSGLKIEEEDKILYEQVSVIMYVERHYESFENYKMMGKYTEALDALIKGLVKFDIYHEEAEALSVGEVLVASREKILLKITDEYGISSSEAVKLADMYLNNYTQYYIKIQAYGEAKNDSNN